MDNVDRKLSDLVEKTQDESFKVAIQKWNSSKSQQTIVNDIGKILKGNQPKAFLAWLLDLDAQDEALNKYKLKNDIIKQSVQAIEKLMIQNESKVEKEPTDVIEDPIETQKDNEVTNHVENADDIEENGEKLEVNKDIKNPALDINETRKSTDNELSNTSVENMKENTNNAHEELVDPVKSIDTNDKRIGESLKPVEETSSIVTLENKTASLTIQSNTNTQNNKHSVEESIKKVHHSEEETNKKVLSVEINNKKANHSAEEKNKEVQKSVEENNKKVNHSVEKSSKKVHLSEEGNNKKVHSVKETCKKVHSVEEESKKVHHSEEGNCKKIQNSVEETNKKVHITEKENKKKVVLVDVDHVIHDKENRRLKCEMCNSSYEATNKSIISCGNCRRPAHDDCIKKTFHGCDLKKVLQQIGGLNFIWLCCDCNSSCKVVVLKDKSKKTSQSTQTSRSHHDKSRSHQKEDRSQTFKDSKDDKNAKKEERTVEEQVNSIRRKLEKVLESGGSNKKTIELLKSLEKLSDTNTFLGESINLNILTSTKIGWTINDIRKNSTDYDVVELAKLLIKKWKKIVPENYRGEESAETPKKKKAVKQIDIKSVLINLPVDKKENTTESKSKEKDCGKDNKGKIKDTDIGSKKKEKENKPKQKETIKASFFENIKKDVEKKEIKKDFEDDEKSVRKTSRSMLLAAVKGDGSLPEDVEKADFDKLAVSIEEAMFGLSKQVNKQYKNLVRSRVFNIKTNAALRSGLLNANISPSRLVTMSSEEMANTNVKSQRDKFCKEGMDRFVRTFGDMQLQGNQDLKITDFKIPKHLAPLTAPTGSSPTVSGLPSASKVSDLTNAGYYSLK